MQLRRTTWSRARTRTWSLCARRKTRSSLASSFRFARPLLLGSGRFASFVIESVWQSRFSRRRVAAVKISLVGARLPLKYVQRALTTLPRPNVVTSVRSQGALSWVKLVEPRRVDLTSLVTNLRSELTVIEVAMPAGGRGRGLSASRFHLGPSQPAMSDEQDLTEAAREILHEWKADLEGGFDEEEAVEAIAWEFVDELDGANGAGEPPSFEDRWATALLDHLVTSGAIELSPKGVVPVHRVAAAELQASAVYACLLSWPSIDEVYIDEKALARAIRQTKPKG